MKVHHDNSDKSVFIGRSNSMSRFLCFKLLDNEIDPGTVTDKVAYYPPKRNQMGKCFSERERKIDSRDEKGSRRRGGLSRAVKAVLFYTKLRRRNQESKIVSKSMRRDSNSSSSSSFLFTTKRSHDFEARPGLVKSSSTRSTSSSISSSSTSSCLSLQNSETCTRFSSSIQNPKPPKQRSLEKQVNLDEGSAIMGFLLILISLTFTILWGKLWAIAVNAIWLYLIPQNGMREKSVEVVEERVQRGAEEESNNGGPAGQKALPSSSNFAAAAAPDFVAINVFCVV